VEEVGRPGSLVGVLDEFEVSEESVALEAGDALVLFTDGITERRREGHLFEEQLSAVLGEAAGRSAGAVARRLEEAAVSYASTVPDDDIAVLVLAVPRLLARVEGADAGTVR
jgi:serine phosphatase RsbU (regulator of sigma subunit)